MVLEKPGAIRAWRALAGPTNSATARESAPGSLRAQFGTDGSQNAVHGSDSAASAAREIAVVFGGGDTSGGAPAAAVERTLALIKPDAYPAHKEEIMELVAAAGFHVVEQAEVRFDRAKAEEFYKEHEGKAFYETLTAWMSSAPIYAIVLEKDGAIAAWRALAGPTNSEKARETAPESVRARFGTDGSQNAVHGSDSPASAAREIAVVFGDSATAGAAAAAAPAAEKAPAPTPPAGSARASVASSTAAGAALRRASKPASAAGGGSKAASAKGGSAAVSARPSKAASRSESAERAPGADAAAAAPLAGAGNAPDGEAAA
ncbi:thioredoxin domain-containing protein 6 [Cladochytrium tenue]|nr:thioredoxin domain-containing protein 6 [Cladochytrium tenue]